MAEGRPSLLLPFDRKEVWAVNLRLAGIINGCGLEKHMQIVEYLKTEYAMGHGHANALVGWTLAGNVA